MTPPPPQAPGTQNRPRPPGECQLEEINDGLKHQLPRCSLTDREMSCHHHHHHLDGGELVSGHSALQSPVVGDIHSGTEQPLSVATYSVGWPKSSMS